MQIKSILAAAAIALGVGLGSAFAAETYDTLHGVPVEILTPGVLDGVRAGEFNINIMAIGRDFGFTREEVTETIEVLIEVDPIMITITHP